MTTDVLAPCFECNRPFEDGDLITADGRVEPPTIRHRDCDPRRKAIKSEAFFDSLTESEIRRRQDLCEQQLRLAYEQRNADATARLRIMEQALTRAMLRRVPA